MKRFPYCLLVAILLSTTANSCGPSVTTTTEATQPSGVNGVTKENLFRKGHELFVERSYDSAAVLLHASLALDSTYLPPLADLAQIHYDLAMRQHGENHPVRIKEFRTALDFYAAMEALGHQDADTYDRLCEVAYALGENDRFLTYAQKNAAKYPYDRQYYNLGLAYAQVGDHANVIRTQKEAIERFKFSPFVGGFYRLLGNGYMDADRNQTAEKTFSAGIEVVTNRLSELRQNKKESGTSEEFRRLTDDKVAMLLSLKKLYLLYKEDEKTREVERELVEMGYVK
jgi:tetratricopeptide (TPR) repeat protein